MLRVDIRRLSTLLGEALARHGGSELLELVEQVRRLSRTSPETGGAEIMTLLSGLDTGTAVALTRAFSQYFQLANTAEQLHRSRELRSLRPAGHRPVHELMRRLAEEFPGEERAQVQDALERLQLRPVFTAHPTESSRQTVLRILRGVSDALDRGAPREELAALVDLLWQTDEIRPGKPTVADEAHAIGSYSSSWAARQCRSWSASSSEKCGRPGSPCRTTRDRSCSAPGWAATATATRSSPPRSPATSSH